MAQCIATRLKLDEGEWFLDRTEGLPLLQSILGHKNLGLASALIRERIMGTPFVTNLSDYSFSFNSTTRAFTVTGKAMTAFGPLELDMPLLQSQTGPFGLDRSPAGGGEPFA